MSTPLVIDKIVEAVADQAAKRISNKVIPLFQYMGVTLIGQGSELKTAWDEVCVEIQGGQSLEWDVYDETTQDFIRGIISEWPGYELQAIWLQTDAGQAWQSEDEDTREPDPGIYVDDIIAYIANEYVYRAASRWSNRRIRAFLDRVDSRDFD